MAGCTIWISPGGPSLGDVDSGCILKWMYMYVCLMHRRLVWKDISNMVTYTLEVREPKLGGVKGYFSLFIIKKVIMYYYGEKLK